MDWNIADFLQRRSKPFRVLFGLALFGAVVLLDHSTDWEITSSVIYLLPVSYFAWHFSPRMGTLCSLLSVLTWLYLNHLKAPRYSVPVVPYWNAALSLALYLFFVFLVAEVKELYLRERENSRLDYLTGLINRRGFYEALARGRNPPPRWGLPPPLPTADPEDS